VATAAPVAKETPEAGEEGEYYYVATGTCEKAGYKSIHDAADCSAAAKQFEKSSTTVKPVSGTFGAGRPTGCSWHRFGNLELWSSSSGNCDVNGYGGCFCTAGSAAGGDTKFEFSILQKDVSEVCLKWSIIDTWGSFGKDVKSASDCAEKCSENADCTYAAWEDDGECTGFKCEEDYTREDSFTMLDVTKVEGLPKSEMLSTYETVEDWLLIIKYKVMLLDAADTSTSDCESETNQLENILWETLDPNNDGKIDQKVFLDACDCKALNGEAKHFFATYDANKDGTITRAEFDKEMKECMEKKSRKTMLRWLMEIQKALNDDCDADMKDVWAGIDEALPKLKELTLKIDEKITRRLEAISDADYEL